MASQRGRNFVLRVWDEFSGDNCFQIAAALAYYTIFSLPPILVICLTIAGISNMGDAAKARIQSEIGGVVGSGGEQMVEGMMEAASQQGRGVWAMIIGFAVLFLGASTAVAQLQAALNQVWEVQPDPEQGGIKNFITKRLLSIGMVVGIGFLLLVSLLLTAALRALSDSVIPGNMPGWTMMAIQAGVEVVVLTLLFAAVYKVMPDAEIGWKDVWVGAFVTGALFVAGKFAIGQYLGMSKVGASFGQASTLVLILVWIYYSAVLVLLGAEFTQVWARRYGSGLQPSPGAVRVVEKTEAVQQSTPQREQDGDPPPHAGESGNPS